MIDQQEVALKLAGMLLEINAVKIQAQEPFTWASGWTSPIYCDHRLILSYPEIRAYCREQLAKTIQHNFIEVDKVCGVATGAIAHGALAADKLRLPFIYVRSKAKGHGTQSLVEGKVEQGEHVVVVEDLISTGGSAMKAINGLKETGCEVVGLATLVSYGFQIAEDLFKTEAITHYSLTDYDHILQAALKMEYIQAADMEVLSKWRLDPANWSPN